VPINSFWKGLVASMVIYQLVLTYFVVKLLDYLLWWVSNDRDHLLDTVPGQEAVWVLGITGGALVVFNLVMFFVNARQPNSQ
jgi:hypothetical protein